MSRTGLVATKQATLQALLEIHERRAMVCHALERLADGLPLLPDAMTVTAITRQLMLFHEERTALDGCVHLIAGPVEQPMQAAVLHRLLADSAQDSYHASDLALELTELSFGPVEHVAERLGYTLRCFFECCRRSSATRALVTLYTLGDGCEPGLRSALIASLRD